MTATINTSYIALCKPGLTSFCVKELESFSAKNIVEYPESVEFQAADLNVLKEIFTKLGTSFSLSQILWQGEDISKLALDTLILNSVIDFFLDKPDELKFRVLCEGISGNETRISLCGEANKIVATAFESMGVKPIIDYKTPQIVFSLSQEPNTKKFTLGLRLHLDDLDKRDWRVYTHKASFRGDFASAICQSAGLTENQNLVSLFSRDGAIVIEAACKLYDKPIRRISKILQTKLSKTPSISKIVQPTHCQSKIFLVDDSSSNIRAANNNAKLAGAHNYLHYIKTAIDEIHTKIEKNSVDVVIVQLTTKDERRINEILSQSTSLLRAGGVILFVGRSGFELEGDSMYSLLWHKLIPRGSGSISLHCFEKK